VRDGDPNSRVLDREITDPKLNIDALVSYTTEISEREWRFAVNAYNVLDDQKRYGEIYNRPRNFRLSASVQF
jgi:outer membrane receptor protein involved in Fe transport